MSVVEAQEGVSEEVAELLLKLQPRCIECGGTYNKQIHHRVFRSEGDEVLRKFLIRMSSVYSASYNRSFAIWFSIHDIQNLCVLCEECHEGKKGVHGGNEVLRQKLRDSFTCPITGFNIPFFKENLPY